jgi:hypothetical protein
MRAVHTISNLSIPRGAMSAAPLFVGGGGAAVAFAGGGLSGAPKGTPPSNAVEVFNLTTRRWWGGGGQPAIHLPHARAGSSTSGGWLSVRCDAS